MILFDLKRCKHYHGELAESGDGSRRRILYLKPLESEKKAPARPVRASEAKDLYLVRSTLSDISALDGAGYHLPIHPRARVRRAKKRG